MVLRFHKELHKVMVVYYFSHRGPKVKLVSRYVQIYWFNSAQLPSCLSLHKVSM